jgi:hypothetical protein
LFAEPRWIVVKQEFVVFDVEAMQPDYDIELGGSGYVLWRKIDRRRLHAGR